MYDEDFAPRLISLRQQKGVSARDMSLSIGQSPGYIRNIESGNALPSMSAFFYICDYLGITPSEFFNTSAQKPERLRKAISQLENLDSVTFDDITAVINHLATKN
ncbi:MAG: helix-turn-helix transcriptional regulator [Phascolarctobacterium sp.]|nr:helix-turn-helix transcriptional regulator [Phascolarctobacterium sp.]